MVCNAYLIMTWMLKKKIKFILISNNLNQSLNQSINRDESKNTSYIHKHNYYFTPSFW